MKWLKALIVVVLIGGGAFGIAHIRGEAGGKPDAEFQSECEHLYEEENWEELNQLANDWLQQPDLTLSGRAEALLFAADAELQSGNGSRAVEHLLSVPKSHPKAYQSMLAACNLQFGELNQPQKGVETLKLMLAENPNSIGSWQRLIFFYAMTLQRQKMIDAIFESIRTRSDPPDAYAYLAMADSLSFTNGFEKNSNWLRSDPTNEVFQSARVIHLIDSLKSRGFDKKSEDRAGPALKKYFQVFNELRQKHPSSIVLLRYEIKQAIEEFDVEKVEQLLSEIPNSNNDSVLFRYKGWLKFQQNDFDAARNLFLQSIEEFPLDWKSWNELASCYRRLGNLEKSKEAMEVALLGKAIRKEVMQLDNTAKITTPQLKKIQEYAALAGAPMVSERIRIRVDLQQQTPFSSEK